jgi:hypothetical protein
VLDFAPDSRPPKRNVELVADEFPTKPLN